MAGQGFFLCEHQPQDENKFDVFTRQMKAPCLTAQMYCGGTDIYTTAQAS